MSGPPVDVHEPPSAWALLAFFALAFAWSWTCWLLAPALKADFPMASTTLALAGGFGPSLAAVAMVAYSSGTAGLHRWLTRCLQWRVGWRWVVLAFLFPAVFMGLAAAAHVALGGSLPPSPAAGHVGLAALNFLLIFLVGGPLGEEFGWRGYALPALQARWGWRLASLLLGVVWAVWHLPLFYSAGTVQSHLPMGLYALSAVASSVLFAWLFNRSRGSMVPVLVLHTAVNAWSLIIPVMVLPDGSNLRPFQIVVGLLVLTAVALLLRGEKTPNKAVDPAST
jgi:membrane protease YdiL (CAAX protease family)